MSARACRRDVKPSHDAVLAGFTHIARASAPSGRYPALWSSRYRPVDVLKSAQQLGVSLDEIDDLLRLEGSTRCQEASALAEYKLWDVREKINRPEKIEKALGDMVDRCHARPGNWLLPTGCDDWLSRFKSPIGQEKYRRVGSD